MTWRMSLGQIGSTEHADAAGRAGSAGPVEHPRAAAQQLAALRARVCLRDRPRPVPRRRRLEHRRCLRRARSRPGDRRLRHRRCAGRAGHPHPPGSLRAGRPHPGGVGRVDLAAPRRRRAHPRPLRRARRSARSGRRDAAPRSAPRPRSSRRLQQRRHAGAPVGRRGDRRTCCSRTAISPRCRAGTSPPSGRLATRPATSASGRPGTG